MFFISYCGFIELFYDFTMNTDTPILLLEINEISWRILRRYLDQKKSPHLNAFFDEAKQYTSLTVDEGELSPWVVWPSIHRGMPNTKHKVFNLGQDPSTFQGTPIWDEFLKRGKNIGVFGSMQSWPPKNPGTNGFYVADTFAHDSNCYPAYLKPLVEFNLKQVAKNNREVTGGPLAGALSFEFLGAVLKAKIRFRTLFALAKQLVREKFEPRITARRRIFQTVLFWDIFRALYNAKNPPAFSTFFTNHAAGVMHRYWNEIFPEDFPKELRKEDNYHLQTMDFAMQVLDDMMADVAEWRKENPQLTIIFATGMGQDTVIRDKHNGFELTVHEPKKFMSVLGLKESEYKPLLAMAPQTAFEIDDDDLRKKTKELIVGLKMPSGARLFSLQEEGKSLSLTILYENKADCLAKKIRLPDGKECSFFQAGIKAWETDAGTAYHIPEGVFALVGPGAETFAKTQKEPNIPADKIKEKIMAMGGLAAN